MTQNLMTGLKKLNKLKTEGGTANLYDILGSVLESHNNMLERQRAMLLSMVDDIERLQGFGKPGGPGPRTASKNRFWRNNGRPPLYDD